MFLSTIQVAERLEISTEMVKQLIKAGTLPHLPVNENSKRKYYKVDERAVLDYKRSLRQARQEEHAAVTPTPVTSTPTPSKMPSDRITLSDAATKLGIKRQSLYDRLKYHKEDFHPEVVQGHVMTITLDDLERETRRRAAAAGAAAGAAAVVGSNGHHANPPAITAQSGIMSALDRIEKMQVAANLRLNELTTKIDSLLKVWS